MLDSLPAFAVEDFTAHLVALYLENERTTMGLAAAVEIHESQSAAEARRPYLLVSSPAMTSDGPGSYHVSITLELCTTSAGTGERTATQTQATEAQWIAAIRAAMVSGPRWRAFLITLPDAAICTDPLSTVPDWYLIAVPRVTSGTQYWDPETLTRTRATEFTAHFRIVEA
jgi:hypothetical protein